MSIGGGKNWHLPQSRDNYRFKHHRYEALRGIYFDTDEISVCEDDIVFDIGAYIGVTSIVAAGMAKKVYAIEPSPIVLPCLQKNTEEYENIEVIQCAVGDRSGEVELQHGISPSEDSVITPDDGGMSTSSIVPMKTVEELTRDLDIGCLDYLKIEAEGIEPEICKGIGDADVAKISVACGEERYGKNVQNEVVSLLEEKGYDVYPQLDHPDKMVYAK